MKKEESLSLFLEIKQKNSHHFDELKKIVLSHTDEPEGDCFWYHKSTVEADDLKYKQYNLYYLGSKAKNIVEIGFNAGHSALLMILGNDTSKLRIFDLCEHSYTIECFNYLNSNFPGRLEIHKGNSLETVPEYYEKNKDCKYDLIHVDGFHEASHVKKDFMNVKKLGSKNGVIILDDDNLPDLTKLHREFIEYELVKLNEDPSLYETKLYTHLVCELLN